MFKALGGRVLVAVFLQVFTGACQDCSRDKGVKWLP